MARPLKKADKSKPVKIDAKRERECEARGSEEGESEKGERVTDSNDKEFLTSTTREDKKFLRISERTQGLNNLSECPRVRALSDRDRDKHADDKYWDARMG